MVEVIRNNPGKMTAGPVRELSVVSACVCNRYTPAAGQVRGLCCDWMAEDSGGAG